MATDMSSFEAQFADEPMAQSPAAPIPNVVLQNKNLSSNAVRTYGLLEALAKESGRSTEEVFAAAVEERYCYDSRFGELIDELLQERAIPERMG